MRSAAKDDIREIADLIPEGAICCQRRVDDRKTAPAHNLARMGLDIATKASQSVCELNELRVRFRVKPERKSILAIPETPDQPKQVYGFVVRQYDVAHSGHSGSKPCTRSVSPQAHDFPNDCVQNEVTTLQKFPGELPRAGTIGRVVKYHHRTFG
jgi:hypothetical protein